jgi:hypothetical protein
MREHLEWIRLYRSALREADPAKQLARIEEAKRAMKQALGLAVEYEDPDQRHAISEALSHLENIQRSKQFTQRQALSSHASPLSARKPNLGSLQGRP